MVAPGLVAVTTAPVGALAMASPWLIHTVCSAGVSASRTEPASVRVSGVRPYSPPPVSRTVPPQSRARSCAP